MTRNQRYYLGREAYNAVQAEFHKNVRIRKALAGECLDCKLPSGEFSRCDVCRTRHNARQRKYQKKLDEKRRALP